MGEFSLPSQLLGVVVLFGFGVILVLPWWRIFSKAGFPVPLALLMWVPFVNLVLLFWFAF
jgi:hypothetical protein